MLSTNHVRFFELLEKAPYLAQCFCSEERAYNPSALNEIVTRASHGQALMSKFFLNLWKNKNEMDFDLFEAANTLDADNRRIITNWLQAPFWP